jgi:hypothetical protein
VPHHVTSLGRAFRFSSLLRSRGRYHVLVERDDEDDGEDEEEERMGQLERAASSSPA